MVRKFRVKYPGVIYHVMDRGDRREALLVDDGDRESLLQMLTKACQKTGWHLFTECAAVAAVEKLQRARRCLVA